MDERQKLIDRINNLLQLASKNPNQAEAQAAQNKAFKLMSDNNIAMSEVIMPGTDRERASEYTYQADYECSRSGDKFQDQVEYQRYQLQSKTQQEAYYRQQAEQAAYERMRAEQAAYQQWQQEQQRTQSQAVPKSSDKEMIMNLLIGGTVITVICYALFPTLCKFIVFIFCLALGLYVLPYAIGLGILWLIFMMFFN